jgi:glucose-1-phosphate thymidylyltransferase
VGFSDVKGIILAGGKGTRLRPITQVVNKHVLPVYDEPLIYYPVNTLIDAGIDEILVISNAEHIGKYIELLEAADFDASFTYQVQSEPKGIAHGVGLAEDFIDDDFVVILGDNLIFDDISDSVEQFLDGEQSAKTFVTEVTEPSAYGVASVEDGRIQRIEEKPSSPASNYAVIGLYLYTTDVFDVIDNLEPSDRGEYEITDVNNHYAESGDLAYGRIENEWFDAGTPEGLFQASKYVRSKRRD